MTKIRLPKYPFKCSKCKKKLEEAWEFGPYGWSIKTKEKHRNKEYCKICFEKEIENERRI